MGQVYLISLLVFLCLFIVWRVLFPYFVLIIRVPANHVGILKRVGGGRTNPQFPGIALLPGELGIVPETKNPGYWGVKFPKWNWEIVYHPLTVVKVEEIALVSSKYGHAKPIERKLCDSVECHNFQDARAFLLKGGQKGAQADYLTDGLYFINLEIFTVLTTENVHYETNQILPEQLRVLRIGIHEVGIVTVEDGKPLEGGIAGPPVQGHPSFQNASKFVANGGCRGLQVEILLSGTYTINPWFAKVEKRPFIEIRSDQVGVLISSYGKVPENYLDVQNLNSEEMLQMDYEKLRNLLVDEGHKGVLRKTLDGGMRHPVNTAIYIVELVPTNQIILTWHDRPKPEENYDRDLKAIEIYTKDRHKLLLDVTQVIRISKDEAPIMILTVGSQGTAKGTDKDEHRSTAIRNLVTKVLSETVRNHFRAAASAHKGIDFIDETQQDIKAHITSKVAEALKFHGVIGIETTFTVAKLSEELDREIENKRKIEEQYETEKLRIQRNKEIEVQRINKDIEVGQNLINKERLVQLEMERTAQAMKDVQTQAELKRMLGQATQELEIEMKKKSDNFQLLQLEEHLKIEILQKTINAEGGPQIRALLEMVKNIPENKWPEQLQIIGGEMPDFLSNPMHWQLMQMLMQNAGTILSQNPLLLTPAPLKKIGTPQPAPQQFTSREIEIVIDKDFNTFNKEDQLELIDLLKTEYYIQVLQLVEVQPGSVRITLIVSSQSAENLYVMIRAGFLKTFGIIDVKLDGFDQADVALEKQEGQMNVTLPLVDRKGYLKVYAIHQGLVESLSFLQGLIPPNSPRKNEVFMLLHRLDAVNSINGLIEDANLILREKSKIMAAYLHMIDQLTEEDLPTKIELVN